MDNLPKIGERVKVWPMPGLKVQDGQTTLSDGGRWLPVTGKEVTWSEFVYRQYLSGELLFHDPVKPKAQPDPEPEYEDDSNPAGKE